MKKKKRIANCIMVAVIVIIAAVGILLVGQHYGWFDRKDNLQAVACVNRDKGIVDLTRDGIATHLDTVTALRDGDQLSGNGGAQATIEMGESRLILGENASVTIDCATVDGFAVTVRSGEVFLRAKNAVSVVFGEQSVEAKDSTAVISVRTGSQSIGILSGEVSVGDKALSGGQLASFAANSQPAYAILDATSLGDFFIHCAQDSDEALCFTDDALAKVLTDRQAQKAASSGEKTDSKDNDDTSDKEDNTSHTDGTGSQTDKNTSDSGNKPAGSTTTPSTDPAPSDAPAPSKPDKQPASEEKEEEPSTLTCTIQICCDTILDNMENLDAGKDSYVPNSGTILGTTSVFFSEGETVFDVLKRACDQNGIALEYSYTPLYESYYVEGINHLYEFDCGSESGWMYKVNGWFPNYGCSDYTLSQGDAIVWCYTCNGMGADVGGSVY